MVGTTVSEGRRLRYSERKRLTETGDLGPLLDGEVPEALRNAVWHLYRVGAESSVRDDFQQAFRTEATLHFGLSAPTDAEGWLRDAAPEYVSEFLDLIEIMVETGERVYEYFAALDYAHATAYPNIAQDLNRLFERHRFGYVLEGGEIRKVGSPALSETIVGPAVLASRRSGWEEVERSYREALNHQLGGPDERDDALTAANAAVEAALKAAGYKGANLGPLAADFKANGPLAELADVPGALNTLLQRSGAVRHVHGDAHGKSPGASAVPQALADLAIYWAGAFIVFLAEIAPP